MSEWVRNENGKLVKKPTETIERSVIEQDNSSPEGWILVQISAISGKDPEANFYIDEIALPALPPSGSTIDFDLGNNDTIIVRVDALAFLVDQSGECDRRVGVIGTIVHDDREPVTVD